MSQSQWELIKTIAAYFWPVVTLLIGVFAGGYIANRNQRKHWFLDNKRGEYRTLLTTLTDCGSKLILYHGNNIVAMSPRDQRAIHKAAVSAANVIYNRLFIAKEVKGLNIGPRWQKAASILQNTHNGVAFTKEFDAIMEDIRTAALKDFS